MNGINFRRRMLMGAAHYNAPSPDENITLYDYLVQDGSTYFATNIPVTPTSRIVVSYYAGGSGAVLCGCDHYNSDGNSDYFKIVYLNSVLYMLGSYDSKQTAVISANYAYNFSLWHITCYQGQLDRRMGCVYYAYSDSSLLESKTPTQIYNSGTAISKKGNKYTAPSVTSLPLYILGIPNTDGSINHGNNSAGMKLFYIGVYDNEDNLLNMLKPATKNGIIGLYDTITGQFILPMNGNPSVGNL